ncbi:MAG: hypothetical protein M0R17_05310 [Candidatus Omnitrophica bacterium]|jgi:hypothetical protein|nr:hypothetical protein [Candidatus Omnitrophota bacterium]
MNISLRDRADPIYPENSFNSIWYATRMLITSGSMFKLEYNLPRRWGKTHLCGKLMEEFENVIYIASNDNMCKYFCSTYGYITRTFSANYILDCLRGRIINYILFDEVSSVQVNNVLSYVHPKGYLAVRSL